MQNIPDSEVGPDSEAIMKHTPTGKVGLVKGAFRPTKEGMDSRLTIKSKDNSETSDQIEKFVPANGQEIAEFNDL